MGCNDKPDMGEPVDVRSSLPTYESTRTQTADDLKRQAWSVRNQAAHQLRTAVLTQANLASSIASLENTIQQAEKVIELLDKEEQVEKAHNPFDVTKRIVEPTVVYPGDSHQLPTNFDEGIRTDEYDEPEDGANSPDVSEFGITITPFDRRVMTRYEIKESHWTNMGEVYREKYRELFSVRHDKPAPDQVHRGAVAVDGVIGPRMADALFEDKLKRAAKWRGLTYEQVHLWSHKDKFVLVDEWLQAGAKPIISVRSTDVVNEARVRHGLTSEQWDTLTPEMREQVVSWHVANPKRSFGGWLKDLVFERTPREPGAWD